MANVTSNPLANYSYGLNFSPTDFSSSTNTYGFTNSARPSTLRQGQRQQQQPSPISGAADIAKEFMPENLFSSSVPMTAEFGKLGFDAGPTTMDTLNAGMSPPADISFSPDLGADLGLNSAGISQQAASELAASEAAAANLQKYGAKAGATAAVLAQFGKSESAKKATSIVTGVNTLADKAALAATKAGLTSGAGVLGGVASATAALGPAMLIFTGMSMINSRGIKEISSNYTIGEQGLVQGDIKKKRIANEFDSIVSDFTPELDEVVRDVQASGIDLSNTKVSAGFKHEMDKSTQTLVRLVGAYADPASRNKLLTDYNTVRKEVATNRILQANQDRITSRGKPGAEIKSGDMEPEIGFIDVTNNAGQARRFSFINLDDDVAEKLPEFAGLADTSRETALAAARQFMGGAYSSGIGTQPSTQALTQATAAAAATATHQANPGNIGVAEFIADRQTAQGLRSTSPIRNVTVQARGTSFADFVKSVRERDGNTNNNNNNNKG